MFASTVGQLQLRVRAHGAAREDVQVLQAPAGTVARPTFRDFNVTAADANGVPASSAER